MPRNMPERDSQGRFVSDDDRYRGNGSDDRRRYASSRYEDDDRSRSNGHGGWFGDSRGHAEAARRGWDERRDDRDYDDRRSSSSRQYDDDRGRHYNDDDRSRHSGWYGDPRGHSEASRRGWEGRRDEGDYDDRRTSSRDRDRDDEDRRYGGGRGHGGWFGDSEGHAQAARRGWDERRDDDDRYRRR